MKPDKFLKTIVDPTLRMMEAHPSIGIKASDPARVITMSIAGQESEWKHRRQIGVNYYPQKVGARGYWQCESVWGGPVAIDDVFQKSGSKLRAVCDDLDVPFDKYSVYEAIAWNDTLACVVARLLLWQDPAPLPTVGSQNAAWDYYIRNWRPGAPHQSTWPTRYGQSLAAMGMV